MKISYNWLKNYLDIDQEPEALSKILTLIGLEVEGMETWESVKGGLKGVVTGKVVECKKHPNADRLFVTRVDVGSGTVLPIVCGAPNVTVGQVVPVALPGTTLYKGEESLTLKKTKSAPRMSLDWATLMRGSWSLILKLRQGYQQQSISGWKQTLFLRSA